MVWLTFQQSHYAYYAEIRLKWRQRLKQRNLLENFCPNLCKDNSQTGVYQGTGEKWLDSEYVLKVEATAFACRSGVEWERGEPKATLKFGSWERKGWHCHLLGQRRQEIEQIGGGYQKLSLGFVKLKHPSGDTNEDRGHIHLCISSSLTFSGLDLQCLNSNVHFLRKRIIRYVLKSSLWNCKGLWGERCYCLYMEIPGWHHQLQEGPLIWPLASQAIGNFQESIRPLGLEARGVESGLFANKYSALSGNLHSLLNFWKIKHSSLNHNLRGHEVTTDHAHPLLLAQEIKALCPSRGHMSSIETIWKPWISFVKKP